MQALYQTSPIMPVTQYFRLLTKEHIVAWLRYDIIPQP